MLCHLYSFASFVMLCTVGYPLVNSFATISSDIEISADNQTHDFNETLITTEINYDFDKFNVSTESANETFDGDLSASSAQQLTWVRSTDGKYVSVKPDPNRNSSHLMKHLLKVFDKSADKREDTDLGLPPDIAHEYIDAVNPPKFRIPVQYGKHHYITSSISPVVYENRLQNAGSTLVKTKTNYSSVQKQSLNPNPNETPRNIDLETLLKAELDAKKAELDQSKLYTTAPNLFALLPANNNLKTDHPFIDSNYKTPNRVKTSTHKPYVTTANSVNHFHSDGNGMAQFVYSDGLPSLRVNVPSNKPTIAITTPNSISLITTSSATNIIVMRSTTTTTTTTSTTTARPVHYTKLKIKAISTTTKSTATPTTTTTRATKTAKSTKTPTVLMSTTIANKNNNNKSNDWSSRVNNQTTDRLSESNDSINLITGHKESTVIESHEPYITDNIILRNNKNKKTVVSDDYYSSTESTANKTDYSDFDYADNTALNPNYTVPDGYGEYPGANYRLTTERLAYILIGSCCALSILCLIVVAMSVRCRDMCDEYRSWKKAEKAALRWQRHQYRLAHHQQDLSRYFRTAVEPNPETHTNTRPTPNVITAPAPLFGPTCCHCISCSSSWLFRDVNKAGREWCCQRGYYHPAPRGKLPFGAASTVNTFMPRYANNNSNSNNNCFDDHNEGDTDSLNTNDLLDTHHNRAHNFSECNPSNPCNPTNTRTEQTTRRQQLRRIAQPNGNQNWIHSSEMVDELHKKHSNNINNISRDQTNLNNFRARNRQIGNENIVVWNNNNDERLI